MTCKRVALITCVGNFAKGGGPGHSCIVIDNFVYSFEDIASMFIPNIVVVPIVNIPISIPYSGWKKFNTKDYIKENASRPLIIQELSSRVDATEVFNYISMSISNNEDYGRNGVCSQQAIQAISAGLTSNIDPSSVNTPLNVYEAIKSSGYVERSYYIYDKQGSEGVKREDGIDGPLAKMLGSYSGGYILSKPDKAAILSW